MIKRKSGNVVGVASLAGLRGMPQAAIIRLLKRSTNYFLESLRLDVKQHGIRVLTVFPGFISTQMTKHDEFKMPFMISPQKTAENYIFY